MFHSSHKIQKRFILLSVHFSNDSKQFVFSLFAPTYMWDPCGHCCAFKSWSSKRYPSTSKKQSWASWFMKRLTSCKEKGNICYYWLQYQLHVCLAVGHTVWNITITITITMTLQFSTIQKVLFHIVTHLPFVSPWQPQHSETKETV